MRSDLVDYVRLSPNHSGKRKYPLTRISPHCMAGNLTVEACGRLFADSGREASSNYGIGSDGRIGLYVDEDNRSWCTSDIDNDNRAITIEVANTGGKEAGYPVSQAAYDSLILLMTDICHRYGKTRVLWLGDKAKTLSYRPKDNEVVLTVHRWFANKDCPGAWIMAHLGQIAADVNKKLEEARDLTKDETNAMIVAAINKYHYELMPVIRGAVAMAIEQADPMREELEDVPEYWREDVERLVRMGVIQGDGKHAVHKRDSELGSIIVGMRYYDKINPDNNAVAGRK